MSNNDQLNQLYSAIINQKSINMLGFKLIKTQDYNLDSLTARVEELEYYLDKAYMLIDDHSQAITTLEYEISELRNKLKGKE